MEESYLHTCFAHFGETKTRVVIFFVFCARHVGSSRRIPRPVRCSRTRGRAREIVRGDQTGGSRRASASRARVPPRLAPFPPTQIHPS